jgi:hypothetical protein
MMMDKNKEAVKSLKSLIKRIKDGETIVIDIHASRSVVEKPVHETSGLYREFKPSRECHIELTLVNREVR